MSSLSTSMPATNLNLFHAPGLYGLYEAKLNSVVPLNTAYAYRSTASGQSTPLSMFPRYLPAGSLLSRIATNEKYYSQEENNALVQLQFDFLDRESPSPVDNEASSQYHLPSFFNDVHVECELIHPRPKPYFMATRIMIKEFETIAQKEAEGIEKAWERHYNACCRWPGRSDNDEIIDITNVLSHRRTSTKTTGQKWYQVLEEKKTTGQHLI